MAAAVAAAMSTAVAVAAPARSPLDFKNGLLGRSEKALPKGLKLGEGCLPPEDVSCLHVGKGITYLVEDGEIITVEISRVGGRFLYPFPYGVTDLAKPAEIIAAYGRHGVKLQALKGYPNTFRGSIGGDSWVEFEFEPKGRLSKASVHNISSYL